MDRRDFIKNAGILGAGAATAGATSAAAEANGEKPGAAAYQAKPCKFKESQGQRTLLFFDYYPLMRYNNVSIKQAVAQYVPEGDFADPVTGSTGGGSVFFHEPTGMYRKIYGSPETRVYESEDAIRWRQSPQPNASPHGGQNGPNHVFTLPHRAWGGNVVYHPEAADGFPYKMIILELNDATYEYALKTPSYWLHELAQKVKAKGGDQSSRRPQRLPRSQAFDACLSQRNRLGVSTRLRLGLPARDHRRALPDALQSSQQRICRHQSAFVGRPPHLPRDVARL